MNRFETRIRELTQLINGQYPRPWTSDTQDPAASRAFLIGYNQATEFGPEIAGDHDCYMDALFNRNGRSIRKVYVRARGRKKPSGTRDNIDRFVAILEASGITNVLQTNVVCYSSRMSCDLRDDAHKGGKEIGKRIFVELLREIRPKLLIAHGEKTRCELSRVLHRKLPEIARFPDDPVSLISAATVLDNHSYSPDVIVIPSLAPPMWNRWMSWAWPYLERVATAASGMLREKLPE